MVLGESQVAMKVLFVCSGNSQEISPIIKNQADSLSTQEIEIDFYAIKGRGLIGYLKNIPSLYNHIRTNNYDLIHAHYSLSAFIASLSKAKPLVVSLMGSDVKAGGVYKLFIRVFAHMFSWRSIVVKSNDMYDDLKISRAVVIPNGVNFERFKELDRKWCQQQLGWDTRKQHILFTSNPQRAEKNYDLAKFAVDTLALNNVELHCLNNIPNEQTPLWYNASNVVLMTSLWEGSPNAIKEAMACNCPIISTDVGDVKWLLGNINGFYLTDFSVETCSAQILNALNFSEKTGRTAGRQRIVQLELNDICVAKKISEIYHQALEKQ